MTLNRVIFDGFLFPESCQCIVFLSLEQIDATIKASRGGDFFFPVPTMQNCSFRLDFVTFCVA